MSRSRHFFCNIVTQIEGTGEAPFPVDMLFIKFILLKLYGRRLSTQNPGEFVTCEEELVAEREIMAPVSDFKLLSERPRWTDIMADQLFDMGVPGNQHPDIFEKIFMVAEVAVPGLPILAGIGDILEHIVDSSSDTGETTRAESSTAYTFENILIPAAKSSIEGLEKVRVVDDVIRETPLCVICHENLDHFDDNAAKEEGVVDLDLDHQPMITRLPCSHQFHGYCIVRWLKIHHLCPVCRYPMPTKDEIDKPKSKRSRVACCCCMDMGCSGRNMWHL